MKMKVYDMTHADKVIVEHPICPPLLARMGTGGNQVPMVLTQNQVGEIRCSETVAPTLTGQANASARNHPLVLMDQGGIAIVEQQARVRKLTPIECERLQGFPDNYTRIPWKGKSAEECPDSPRYKAIGNSWAVPCVRWIGKRIQDELEKNK